MKIDVLTLFPGMFDAVLGESIIKRAIASGKVHVKAHNIRDYSKNKHKKVDDKPFGGGPGMVMNPGPVLDCVKAVKSKNKSTQVILMSPQGEVFTQSKAHELSLKKSITIISGHYEGIDERIRSVVDAEISIGDYILTGGEIPAMVVVDAIVRLIPGVLGHSESSVEESFSNGLPRTKKKRKYGSLVRGLLEYPQYTRPAVYKQSKVPDVLLSGNHKLINSWRRKMSISRTISKRPDLIKNIKQLEMGE